MSVVLVMLVAVDDVKQHFINRQENPFNTILLSSTVFFIASPLKVVQNRLCYVGFKL